jgi:hypothetical protein
MEGQGPCKLRENKAQFSKVLFKSKFVKNLNGIRLEYDELAIGCLNNHKFQKISRSCI